MTKVFSTTFRSFALRIVSCKGRDLRKQGSVCEASIARPGEPGNVLCKIFLLPLPTFWILGTLMPDAFLRLNGEMRLFLFWDFGI